MKMKRMLIIAAAALTMCGCGGRTADINKMSLEEKAAQMLMVRCRPDMEGIISAGAGGVVMFASDFEGLTKEEVTEKTAGFQKAAAVPLFIATDEEGGTVVRVSSNPLLRSDFYAYKYVFFA